MITTTFLIPLICPWSTVIICCSRFFCGITTLFSLPVIVLSRLSIKFALLYALVLPIIEGSDINTPPITIIENAYEALIREAKEELNIKIDTNNIVDTFAVNRKNKSLPPYYDVYFEINKYDGKITINEPEKCSELIWADINNLPTDMITFEKEAINNNLKGIKFSVTYADNEEKF